MISRMRQLFNLGHVTSAILSLIGSVLSAQVAVPDPLRTTNGTQVMTQHEFAEVRRPELMRLFEENVYGRTPVLRIPVRVIKVSGDELTLQGSAMRRQIDVAVGERGKIVMHILLYLPAHPLHRVAVIVGLNFDGNQSVIADPGVTLHRIWMPESNEVSAALAKERMPHKAVIPAELSRGSAASQWQVKMILQRGYGLATMYAGDVDPDFDGALGLGIRPLFFGKDQRLPEADTWGTIGAWAWAMSRMVDVLSNDPMIDSKAFIAFGFSRFGKTALWASAQDIRFAITLSNESGQAGATLSRHGAGESIDHMMLAFPYWFCPNYQHFLGRISEMPVDGDMLLSLIAPRALYVGSAIADPFSDPEGEFLAVQSASRVYALYGLQGVRKDDMPRLNDPVGDRLRYHIRPGGHDVTTYDWEQYLNFADRQLDSIAR